MGRGERIRSMIESVEEHDGVELSPVERLLLATDGTVTHMLESLTRGEVDVDILSREARGSTLNRQVVLRRSRDGSTLVWASSDVNLYPLAEEMTDRLVNGDIGIGDLLREEFAETHREIVDMQPVWYDTAEFPSFIEDASVLYLKRKYKVYSGGDRIMTISEYFPKGLY